MKVCNTHAFMHANHKYVEEEKEIGEAKTKRNEKPKMQNKKCEMKRTSINVTSIALSCK